MPIISRLIPRIVTPDDAPPASSVIPTDLPNLICWLDSSDTSTITTHPGLVSLWTDKDGGTSNDASQGTGTSQPESGARLQNGKNVIDYDGTDEFMTISGLTSFLSKNTNYSIAIVFKLDSFPGSGFSCPLSSSIDGSDRMSIAYDANTNKFKVAKFEGSFPYIGIEMTPDTDTHVIFINHNSATDFTVWKDNVAETTSLAAASFAPLTGLTYVGQAGSFVNPILYTLDGFVAEIAIFSDETSVSDREALTNSLITKWNAGVPEPPPTTIPTDLPNLFCWLDGADTSTITTHPGQVSLWEDKDGGTSNDFSQGTSTNQPESGARTLNGKNTIDFDGVDEYLLSTSTNSSLSKNTSYSIAIVFKYDSFPNGFQDAIIASAVSGTDRMGIIYNESESKLKVAFYNGSSYQGLQMNIDLNPHVLFINFDTVAQSYEAWLDNIPVTTGLTGAFTAQFTAQTNLGMSVANFTPDYFMDGLIAEVAMFSDVTSGSDRTNLTDSLMNKWGITV